MNSRYVGTDWVEGMGTAKCTDCTRCSPTYTATFSNAPAGWEFINGVSLTLTQPYGPGTCFWSGDAVISGGSGVPDCEYAFIIECDNTGKWNAYYTISRMDGNGQILGQSLFPGSPCPMGTFDFADVAPSYSTPLTVTVA